MIENKILERRLEANQTEHQRSVDSLTAKMQSKSTEIEQYEARSNKLEKWCAETQERVERESQSIEETNKKMGELNEHYWAKSRENFEQLEQKLDAHDKHLQRISDLETLLEEYRAGFPQPVESTDIEKMIDARIIASIPVVTKTRRLRDVTPIFY